MDPLAEEWKQKGNDLMKDNKYIEAMLNYTQAIKIDGDNPAYYSNRSLAFRKMEQYYFALMDAKEVIRRMPRWTKGHFRRGEVEMVTEHYEEAAQSFQKALETDPNDTTLRNAFEKATELHKQQKRKEGRMPWFGVMFGFVISILLVVLDESIAKDKSILSSDVAKAMVVGSLTLVCYGMGVMYRYFLQSQRCSHFEAPIDLMPEDLQSMGLHTDSPTDTGSHDKKDSKDSKPHSKKKQSSDGTRQRKKGR